ncbi:unnamed protein product, partial [Clonostachys solani]
MDEVPLPVSQASSHLALEPVVAAAVLNRERERRVSNQKLGACRSGCDDIDDYVLMGGLERGSVVGLSSEREDEFGLVVKADCLILLVVQLAVQIIAHSLSQGVVKRVLVITPKPATTILPVLRDGIKAELAATESEWKKTSPANRAAKVRDALDKVMLSCVFDMDGLWEVLADLDRPDPTPVQKVEEIQDSEDEEDDELEGEGGADASSAAPATEKTAPDMIIITHFSSLLSALFSHRSSTAAHAKLQLLASHVRHLSRSLPSNPLILILNSTNTAVDTSSSSAAAPGPTAPPPPSTASYPSERQRKQLDPTLRSIFHNPQPSASYGEGMTAGAAARRYTVTKPAFGLVFAQLLDLHLLCTRVPRSRKDSELLAGVRTAAAAAAPRDRETVEFVTVVEVLLDEMGVWKGTTDGGEDDDTRKWAWKSREQRWGPVVIESGRVVEAFSGAASTKTTNIEP